MKEFKLNAITPEGEKALGKLLTPRDLKTIIPLALRKAGAKENIDYEMKVVN